VLRKYSMGAYFNHSLFPVMINDALLIDDLWLIFAPF